MQIVQCFGVLDFFDHDVATKSRRWISSANAFAIMPTGSDDLDIVRRINVFRGLNLRMIHQMVAPATTLSLRAHQVVCRQDDDPATAFFIVVDGWIKLYRITIAGDEAVVNDRYQVPVDLGTGICWTRRSLEAAG